MKILFLTEAGGSMGNGHLNRCTALADGFSKFECDITFYIRGALNIYPLDREYDISIKEWSSIQFLSRCAKKYDIVVVDTYEVKDTIYRYIGEEFLFPIYIIDSKFKYYPKGIILFPSAYADDIKLMEKSKSVTLISGMRYLLFTRELWDKKYTINKRIQRIGISLGAVSAEKILKISFYKKIFRHLQSIKVFGEIESLEGKEFHNDILDVTGILSKGKYVEQIAKLDLLITNGGQSLNEALFLGIPTIATIVADNQEKNVNKWSSLGLTTGIDIRNNIDTMLLADALKNLKSYRNRILISKRSRRVILNGSLNASSKIMKLYNNYNG